jgi:hypothetical protein
MTPAGEHAGARDEGGVYGAAAGAIAVMFFAIAALIIGAPDLDASGAEVARRLSAERTWIQIGCAVSAASIPFLVWFLATVASLTRWERPAVERAGAVAYGCGLVFAALYLTDVSALATGALRPETMAAAPELASALRDLEWMAAGMAGFLGAGVLAGFSILTLRHGALWPRWLGWLAALAAFVYTLRIGTLFTTNGPFAADGALGLWAPVIAITTWLAAGSVSLTLSLRRRLDPA